MNRSKCLYERVRSASAPVNHAGADWTVRQTLALILAIGIPMVAGCSDPSARSELQVRSEIEKPKSTNTLTPAERDRRFHLVFDRGVSLAQRRQSALALAAFQEAVRLRPDSPDALFNLGACYEELGDPMRAVNLYRRVLTITPDDPACYFNLGTSYIKMYYRDKSPGWRKMARTAWRRSLALKPGQGEVEQFLAATERLD